MKIIRGDELDFVPASHEDSDNPGVLKKVLATHQDLVMGQVQMVNWAKLPVGQAFASHYHEDMQEIFVIVQGQVAVQVDGVRDQLNRGDAILIDAREVHKMKNVGQQEVNYVVFGISTGQGGQTVVCEGQ